MKAINLNDSSETQSKPDGVTPSWNMVIDEGHVNAKGLKYDTLTVRIDDVPN